MAEQCIACKLDLVDGATICPNCGTAQTWKRYLAFSSTILSLLIAFASVSALAIPILVKTFHTPTSSVKAILLKTGPLKFDSESSLPTENGILYEDVTYQLQCQLLLTNPGDRPGFVTSGALTLKSDERAIATGAIAFAASKVVVDPNAHQVVDVIVQLNTVVPDLFPDKLTYVRGTQIPSVAITGGDLTVYMMQYNQSTRDSIRQSLSATRLNVER